MSPRVTRSTRARGGSPGRAAQPFVRCAGAPGLGLTGRSAADEVPDGPPGGSSPARLDRRVDRDGLAGSGVEEDHDVGSPWRWSSGERRRARLGQIQFKLSLIESCRGIAAPHGAGPRGAGPEPGIAAAAPGAWSGLDRTRAMPRRPAACREGARAGWAGSGTGPALPPRRPGRPASGSNRRHDGL
jgi:hypothetical protein